METEQHSTRKEDWRTHLAPRLSVSCQSGVAVCPPSGGHPATPASSTSGCDECCVRPSPSLDTRASLLKPAALAGSLRRVRPAECTRECKSAVYVQLDGPRLALLCTQHPPPYVCSVVPSCEDPPVEAAKPLSWPSVGTVDGLQCVRESQALRCVSSSGGFGSPCCAPRTLVPLVRPALVCSAGP